MWLGFRTIRLQLQYFWGMKLRGLILAVAFTLATSTTPVIAEDVVPSRADFVTSIQNQYGPLFDAEWEKLLHIAIAVKGDAATYKQYKAAVLDFKEVRRVIDEGLASSSSDLIAIKAYAEEETGEFAVTIDQLEKTAATIKSITCRKGKITKKVTGIKPVCPKGYTKKK